MGLYQDALEDARESIRLDGNFAKGYVRIAKCCLALGDLAAALNAINKAEELDPHSGLANEKRSLQMLQQFAEDMEKSYAKRDYRKVYKKKLKWNYLFNMKLKYLSYRFCFCFFAGGSI